MTEEKTKSPEELKAENERLRAELEAVKKKAGAFQLHQTHDVEIVPLPASKPRPFQPVTTNLGPPGRLIQTHDLPDPEETRKKREAEEKARLLEDVKRKRKEGAK